MGSAIVSGRVDEDVKARAAVFIEALGLTVGDVIKNVWESIALTGQVPLSVAQEAAQDSRTELFDEFAAFSASLPPCSEETAAMSERQMRHLVASRYV